MEDAQDSTHCEKMEKTLLTFDEDMKEKLERLERIIGHVCVDKRSNEGGTKKRNCGDGRTQCFPTYFYEVKVNTQT